MPRSGDSDASIVGAIGRAAIPAQRAARDTRRRRPESPAQARRSRRGAGGVDRAPDDQRDQPAPDRARDRAPSCETGNAGAARRRQDPEQRDSEPRRQRPSAGPATARRLPAAGPASTNRKANSTTRQRQRDHRRAHHSGTRSAIQPEAHRRAAAAASAHLKRPAADDGVAQQHRDRHRADAAGHRGDRRGHLGRRVEVDVADEAPSLGAG